MLADGPRRPHRQARWGPEFPPAAPSRPSNGHPKFSSPRDFSQPPGGQSSCKSPYDRRMGKASRTKNDTDRRARIAAQREQERRAAQRKRIYWAGGAILAVVIVVVALVLVKLNTGGNTS